MESTGLSAAAIDDCMRLGAGMPMGPLKLLDFVGLDVSVAIGDSIADETGVETHRAPQPLRDLEAEGKLGRKSGEGFFTY